MGIDNDLMLLETCDSCDAEYPVGFNDDGELLCEDCLTQWLINEYGSEY